MNDIIETLDDLHDAMITRYPALVDRERYAAIYAKMECQWLWFDALQREGQDRLAVMARWVRLDTWGLDDANTLCEIEQNHIDAIYDAEERYELKRKRMCVDAHDELEEAMRNLLIERADAQEMSEKVEERDHD